MVEIIKNKEILSNPEFNFVDMHHHSSVSDGARSPEFLAKYFKKKNLGLAITDHNEIRGSVYLSKNTDLFTIPGIEITTKQAKDVLAYFYNIDDLIAFWEKEVKPKVCDYSFLNYRKTTIDIFDLLDKIGDFNGVSVLAHPCVFGPKRSVDLLQNPDFFKNIDAIESHNFLGHTNSGTTKQLFAFDKPVTAGSDSHRISPCATLTGAKTSNVEEFLSTILKKQNIIFSQTKIGFTKLFESWVVARNNINLKLKRF